MREFRLSVEAEGELDEIWLHLARSSGSVAVANRVLDDISDRFWLLAQHPHLGRRRDKDWRPGLRSFVAEGYIVVHRVADNGVVLILHVFHGSRDIEALLRDEGV